MGHEMMHVSEMMSVYRGIQKFKHSEESVFGVELCRKRTKNSICAIQKPNAKAFILLAFSGPIKALKCASKMPLSPL